jgi:hypothetical protein
MKSEPGPLATLGSSAAAQVRLIVWCKECRHQVEPAPAEMARQYGSETSVLDRREQLVARASRHAVPAIYGLRWTRNTTTSLILQVF